MLWTVALLTGRPLLRKVRLQVRASLPMLDGVPEKSAARAISATDTASKPRSSNRRCAASWISWRVWAACVREGRSRGPRSLSRAELEDRATVGRLFRVVEIDPVDDADE